MALVKCIECDKEFSNTRPDCPHCGAYIKGFAPSQMTQTDIDPELKKLLDERKFKNNTLEKLKTMSFSEPLFTYKNGMMKKKRSLTFGYFHGEVVSFNSYVDTDVKVSHSTVNEVSNVTRTNETYRDGRNSNYISDISTSARRVVSDVSVNKSKITELAIKLNGGQTKKYFFRGPEIDFLKSGDPVTIGFFIINWKEHSEIANYEDVYGQIYKNETCPVMFINRSNDADPSSIFISNPSIFENKIFNEDIGLWKASLIVAVILGFFMKAIILFILINVIALICLKWLFFKKGQKQRRQDFFDWWYAQSDNAINFLELKV